jgi:hypothetical protein
VTIVGEAVATENEAPQPPAAIPCNNVLREMSDIRSLLDKQFSSPICSADDRHQFFDLATLLSLVSGRDRVLNTMADVVPKNFLFDPSQCRTHGCNLRYDVDAVAIFLDHTRYSANLAFDSRKPFLARRLDVMSHGV